MDYFQHTQEFEDKADEAIGNHEILEDAVLANFDLIEQLRNTIPCFEVAKMRIQSVQDLKHLDSPSLTAIANAAIILINKLEDDAIKVMETREPL